MTKNGMAARLRVNSREYRKGASLPESDRGGDTLDQIGAVDSYLRVAFWHNGDFGVRTLEKLLEKSRYNIGTTEHKKEWSFRP